MTKEKIREILIEIIRETVDILEDKELQLPLNIEHDLNISSMDFIMILVKVEESFDIVIDDYNSSIQNLLDIDALTECIYTKLNKKGDGNCASS